MLSNEQFGDPEDKGKDIPWGGEFDYDNPEHRKIAGMEYGFRAGPDFKDRRKADFASSEEYSDWLGKLTTSAFLSHALSNRDEPTPEHWSR
jgi:hypothetical protein